MLLQCDSARHTVRYALGWVGRVEACPETFRATPSDRSRLIGPAGLHSEPLTRIADRPECWPASGAAGIGTALAGLGKVRSVGNKPTFSFHRTYRPISLSLSLSPPSPFLSLPREREEREERGRREDPSRASRSSLPALPLQAPPFRRRWATPKCEARSAGRRAAPRASRCAAFRLANPTLTRGPRSASQLLGRRSRKARRRAPRAPQDPARAAAQHKGRCGAPQRLRS